MNEIMFSRGGFPVITKFLFDNVMSDVWNNDMLKMKSSYPMNIVEVSKDNEVISYRLEFAFAGFEKDEISVEVNENILKINVSRKQRIFDEGYKENYLRQGLSYKDYEVSYKLMDEVDKKKIKVSFANGILYIVLPLKKEVNNSYKIEIE